MNETHADIKVGLSATEAYEVTDDMSPPHLPTKVLSTPDMIKLIEGTCLTAVQPLLGDARTTVGIHVCVSHQAAVASGERIKVTGTITEVDRKRLVFEVSVMHGDVVVSKGTHERFIVSG